MSSMPEQRQVSLVALPGEGSVDHRSTAVVPIASLLPSDSPRIDGESDEHVRTLVELGDNTPPIVVHRTSMRVVDGMHRLRAAVLRGQDAIDVRFIDSSEADLFVLAVELNATHGLPLSLADRNAAAARVVASHPHWSDRVIASLTGLSAKTVASIRRRATEDIPQLHDRIGRDGKARPRQTANGRRLASRLMSERPEASLREIARESGISVGTVRDVRKRLHMGLDPVPPKQRDLEQMRDHPVRPGSVVGLGRNVPAVGVTAAVVERLKKDPSLRFSDLGRTILRLLDAHSITATTWAQLAEGIPTHCAAAVADVARRCADGWVQFAEQVERRGNDII